MLKLGADRVGVDLAPASRSSRAASSSCCRGRTWRRPGGPRSFSLKPSSRRREERIFRPLFGQRIHPRDGVSEGPVGVDQPIDPGLERALAGSARGGAATAERRFVAEYFQAQSLQRTPANCCRPTPDSSPNGGNFHRSGRDCHGSRMKGAWSQVPCRRLPGGKLTLPGRFDVRLQRTGRMRAQFSSPA